MAMWPVIIKNNSGSDVEVEDLGIIVPDTDTITFSDSFTYPEMAGSDDLRTLVGAGTLVLNDGSSDLSASDGVDYLTFTKGGADYYSKTEMQTSGQAQMHWDNLTNVPSFGSPTWIDPVEYRILGFFATPPGSPTTGDVYIDTDDDHYYKYDGAAWQDQGAASDDERVIDLNDATENVYERVSGTWTDQGQADDGAGVLVKDDGDGKQAQYVYDSTAGIWTKIADVDFDGNTLDEAYDQGGPGAGRTITADSGPVKIDHSTSNEASLEIVPRATAPTTGLAGGQVDIIDGIPAVYDSTRAKWLSMQRMYVAFGARGNKKNLYLGFYSSKLASNNTGLRMLRDMTITGISGQLDASGTCDFRVRKNKVATNILSLSLSSTDGAQNVAANVDLNQADRLQCYLENTSNVQDPLVLIELAYRF